MREFRLVFGATTAAVSSVLAIFMAGLGAGSAILGPRADKSANPLRMYGLLELGIAASAAVTPWLIAAVGWAYVSMGGQGTLGLAGASIVRLALAALVMAAPAFLMGGTLPAAVRAVTSPRDTHRRAIGVLYGANTLGAVAGSGVATFIALEKLGTHATLWAGCAVGAAIGGLAIALARGATLQIPDEREDDIGHAETTDPAALRSNDFRPGWIYAVAATLGFAFFALEIVWYRMLAPILGGTTFTFGLILGAALLGIGVGGLAYNFLFARLRPTWSALAITCGLEAVFIMIPYALGDRVAVLAAWYSQGADGFGQLISGWCVITSIVVLPPALVSGVQFPLLIGLLGRGRQRVSKHVGAAYAWNTMGAITGSLVAGFGSLPLMGATGMWRSLGGLIALLSILTLARAGRQADRKGAAVVGLAIAVALMMFATGPTAAWRHSGIGAGRAVIASFTPNGVEYWRNTFRENVVWEADGIEASVGIKRIQGYDFVVNGKTDGNSLNDAPTQVGVAVLGAVTHPDPRSALVIGLGTGESAGWLAEMRNMARVDVVELEPAIDKMASLCAELNFDVLNHPKVRRVYNDGREFVLTASDKYDVIISEPSNPYRAGVATLYTREFYEAARERLGANGVFIQFLQAYEVDDATVATVLATVRSAFQHVEVWQTQSADLQLVCSPQPLEYSTEDLRQRVSDPTIHRALEDVWRTPGLEGLLSHFVAGAPWVDQVAQTAGVPLNTDDRTVLEYSFAKTVGRATPFSIEAIRGDLAGSAWTRPNIRGDAIDWRAVELRRQCANASFNGQFSVALLPKPEDQALVRALMHYRANRFHEALAEWPEEHLETDIGLARLILARCYAETGNRRCLEALEPLGGRMANDVAAILVTYYTRAGAVPDAEKAFTALIERLRDDPWTLRQVSETAFSRAVDLARADREVAKRIYPLFAEPYAARQFDYIRKMAGWLVANQIGPEAMADALAPMEPHVPWMEELLEARARVYRLTNSPLERAAASDWRRFQRQAD